MPCYLWPTTQGVTYWANVLFLETIQKCLHYTHAGFVRSEKMLTLRVIFISAEEDEERNLRRISYLRATKEDRTQPYYSDEDDGGLSRHLSGGHKR